MKKIVGFQEKDLPALNEVLEDLDRRLGKLDKSVPTAETDETKFSHKLPIVIGGSTYYIMLTST